MTDDNATKMSDEELTIRPDIYRFSAKLSYHAFTSVYIHGDKHDHVWFDTYGMDIHNNGGIHTVYASMHPDDAEKIGLALIAAAKITRGERL